MLIPTALLVSILQSTLGSSGHCPSAHWLDASVTGLDCLLFNSTTSYTWEAANNYCQVEENASLVEVWTQLQMDVLRSELTFLTGHEKSRSWWTGGMDLGREDRFYWAHSLTPVRDFVWNIDQPNGGNRYNCIVLFSNGDFFGHDTYCSSPNYYPICQKKH
jgi:hypothetical protein